MSTQFRPRIAVVIAWLLMLAGWQGSPAQQAPPPPEDVQTQPKRWPMVIDSGGEQVTIYEPQLDSFEGEKIAARAAISVLRPGQQDPVFGAIWLDSRVATDRTARTVQILDVTVPSIRLPGAAPEEERSLKTSIGQFLTDHPAVLSLDHLLKMLEVVQKQQAASGSLVNDPPKIIYREHPAVKVQYDGPPRLVQVADSTLLRAINTPFFVVLMPSSRTYYLKGAGQWYAAPDGMGPFQPAATVPPEVTAVAEKTGYKDPQENTAAAGESRVEIITATEPTELVWTNGPPEMSAIPHTGLLYVANTDSDLFLNIDTQDQYVLLSGRWYSAKDRNGPWTFVPPDKLPDDFHRIPANSEKGHVLAQVPGTPVAQDAVMDTYVPQTAAIDRRTVERPPVTYDGEPQFQPVADTQCSYAVNTAYPVIQVSSQYYCCWNAVWYSSPIAVGPWDVCVSVPREIYALPPSCPVYSVRYCYVYDSTPDVVYCGYTPGYVGCYTYGGCVVYGTGYYYRPWFGREHYYPRPCTFGFAARYDAYSNDWGFHLAVGGGERWINPERRSVAEGGWFGYGGYRPAVIHNDVTINRTVIKNVTVNRTNINVTQNNVQYTRNVYERRRDVRADIGVRPRPVEARPQEIRAQDSRVPQGRPQQVNRAPEERQVGRNDVLVDPKGNVYRKTEQGWESRQGERWVTEKPAVQEPARAAEKLTEDRRGAGRNLGGEGQAKVEDRGPNAGVRDERNQGAAQANETEAGARAQEKADQARQSAAEAAARAQAKEQANAREHEQAQQNQAEAAARAQAQEQANARERGAKEAERAQVTEQRQAAESADRAPRQSGRDRETGSPAPAEAARAPANDRGRVDDDYRARQAGDDRPRSYRQPDPAPAGNQSARGSDAGSSDRGRGQGQGQNSGQGQGQGGSGKGQGQNAGQGQGQGGSGGGRGSGRGNQ